MKSMGSMMSPKGPRRQTFGLLLLVTVACLWLPCKGAEYDDFLKRHVDYPKPNLGNDDAYCKEIMRDRDMVCWQSNTFIHASEEELQALCRSRGHLVAEMYRSPTSFPITVCSRRERQPSMPCSYMGKSVTQKIWVTCLKGLPVHFHNDG